jgi:hypothetical protein
MTAIYLCSAYPNLVMDTEAKMLQQKGSEPKGAYSLRRKMRKMDLQLKRPASILWNAHPLKDTPSMLWCRFREKLDGLDI